MHEREKPFTICIEQGEENGTAADFREFRISLEEDGGPPFTPFTCQIPHELIQDMMDILARRLKAGELLDQKTEEVGGRLFDCLFQPALLKRYQQRRLQAGMNILPVRLRIGSRQAAVIPWEMLYDTHETVHEYLALDNLIEFSRCVSDWKNSDVEKRLQTMFTEECRIQVVLPGKRVDRRLNLKQQVELMTKRLPKARKQGDKRAFFQIEKLQKNDEMFSKIDARFIDIFHYMGHSAYDGKDAHFPKEFFHKLDATTISGRELIRSVRKLIPLVFLNSCNTSNGEYTYSNIGFTLSLERKALGVLCMQCDISDAGSNLLAEEIYQGFQHQRTFAESVQRARQKLQNAKQNICPDWVAPVFYWNAHHANF